MMVSRRRAYLYVISAVVLIIVLHYGGALKPFERVWEQTLSFMSEPVYGVVARIKSFPGFQEKAALEQRIDSLEERVHEFYSLKTRISILEEENAALTEALSWRERKDRTYRIGKIIGTPLHASETHLIINLGSSNGIKNGLPVIIKDDFLIGTISKTNSNTAIVRLLSDNESIVSAKRADGQDPIGIVQGELGLSLRLGLIPVNEPIEHDTLIVTSGLDANIPGNLVIGVTGSDLATTDNFFKSVSVHPFYQKNKLNIVSIILP